MIYSISLSGPITHRIHSLMREGQINRTSVRELIRKHRLISYCLVAWFANLWVYATLGLIKRKCLVAIGWREITLPTWCDPIIECKDHKSRGIFFSSLVFIWFECLIYYSNLFLNSFFLCWNANKKNPIRKFHHCKYFVQIDSCSLLNEVTITGGKKHTLKALSKSI